MLTQRLNSSFSARKIYTQNTQVRKQEPKSEPRAESAVDDFFGDACLSRVSFKAYSPTIKNESAPEPKEKPLTQKVEVSGFSPGSQFQQDGLTSTVGPSGVLMVESTSPSITGLGERFKSENPDLNADMRDLARLLAKNPELTKGTEDDPAEKQVSLQGEEMQASYAAKEKHVIFSLRSEKAADSPKFSERTNKAGYNYERYNGEPTKLSDGIEVLRSRSRGDSGDALFLAIPKEHVTEFLAWGSSLPVKPEV